LSWTPVLRYAPGQVGPVWSRVLPFRRRPGILRMSRSLFARLAARHGPPVDARARREFLRATLAASAGLLLSGVPGASATVRGGAGKRVVVIGAGFAGLACAYELRSAGYDVTVI